MHILLRLSVIAAFMALFSAACANKATGLLTPPPGAPAWKSDLEPAFNDNYTAVPVTLTGRAPNDVRDQELFRKRMGESAVIALVEVEQVTTKQRNPSLRKQYLDLRFKELLLGELPKKTSKEQLIEVRSSDPLPGTLKGEEMLLFLRWAPGAEPPYHHHLIPADEETLSLIRAHVSHAKKHGSLRKKP